MDIRYDKEKLSKVLIDFYNATKINCQILRTDYTPLFPNICSNNRYCATIHKSKIGESLCSKSDVTLLEKCCRTGKVQMHICHAGLADVGVPVVYNDEIIAYIILGQMKIETDFSKIIPLISKFASDITEMEESYGKLECYDKEKTQSVANIASMLAKYILTENIIGPDINRNIEAAKIYIDANLDKRLNAGDISENINVSKSVIYKNFHEYFGCTVSEYVNSKRVEKAIEFLCNTDLSIEEIALKTGFSSASYFTRVFVAKNGISPLKFRKKIR